VRYATLSEPVDDGGLSRVPVQIAPVGAPTFHVGDTALRPAPIAPVATPVLKLEQPSTAPRALHTVAPVYPPEALLNGVEGQVVVEFSLDAAGVPGDLDVVGASMGQFDVAALQALADWRFAPPDVPGRRYRQTFTFKVGAETAGDATVPRGCLVSTGTHICRQVLPGVVLQKSVR
jgi:TonB family protein